MASDFYYNVYIGVSPPAKPIGGWIWIHPAICQAFIYIIDSWKPFAGGVNPITDYVEGTSSWLKHIEQEAVPTGLDAVTGKIWIQPSTNQAYILLDTFISFAGG